MFLCISHLNLREGNHAQISTILSLRSNFLIFAVFFFFCPLTVALQLLNPRHKSSSRKNLAGCAILFNKDTFYSNVGVKVDLVMGDFNGTAWRSRSRDNLRTMAYFLKCDVYNRKEVYANVVLSAARPSPVSWSGRRGN